jgi:HPt (histidine-containing phosphotransfer) domain-containing protein
LVNNPGSSECWKLPLSKPIDLEHLARYTGGEKALNAEILRLFDSQVTDMVGQLNGMLAVRDAKRWREIAHTIKGAARGVGAFGMGDAAAAAEPVDPANAEKALAAIKTLEVEAESVRGFIQNYLAA